MSLIQRENHVAMIKGATWGTAATPTAGVYVKGHTPPKGARKVITNEDEFGRGMASSAELLEFEGQSGSMSLRVYSEGLESILASLMGQYKYTVDGGGDGYNTHTYKLATGMASMFHTIAWDEGSEVKAVNSARLVSGNFSYADGLNLDINYLGDKVSITGWSNFENTLSYPSKGKSIFKLSNAQVLINGEEAAALSGSDELKPSGIDIAVTRGFEALAVTAGSDSITEPIEKTAPVVEVTLTFPKKETATAAYFNAFNNRDFKKMQISFAGEGEHKMIFNFPRVFLAEAPDFAQDTPIPTTLKLKALVSDLVSLPAGMSYNVPYIQLRNDLTDQGEGTTWPAIS